MIAAVAGMTADASILVENARNTAQSYWRTFGCEMPVEQLVQRLGNLKQGYTQIGGLRPFGVSLLYAGHDSSQGFQLYLSDPSGNYAAWKATAVGSQSTIAQSILKNDFKEGCSLEEAKFLALKIMKKTLGEGGASQDGGLKGDSSRVNGTINTCHSVYTRGFPLQYVFF